jgi:nucleoside-diphosphate-sugar epimerase
MRVLVTGAGGLIGSEVVGQLLERNHEVIALDRPGPMPRLSRWQGRITVKAVDLDDAEAMPAVLAPSGLDAIIHLAWYADPRDYLTSTRNLASLATTTRLVEAAVGAGCRKLVMAGSCVEYAPCDRRLVETDPAGPATLYGACKHAACVVSGALAGAAPGAELSWARIFHLHGPLEDAQRLIPWVARELRAGRAVELTDGTQVRDHLHVMDVASGLVTLLAPGASGIYNVCSGEPVTLRQVLETVGEIAGGRSLLRFGARSHRPGETMFLAGDSGRLRALGWSPRFGLRDGLADALRGGN